MKLQPMRLSCLGGDRYELELADEKGERQTIICTVVAGDVTHVRSEPNPFMRATSDPRPIYAAIVAFHRACTGQSAPSTGEPGRSDEKHGNDP